MRLVVALLLVSVTAAAQPTTTTTTPPPADTTPPSPPAETGPPQSATKPAPPPAPPKPAPVVVEPPPPTRPEGLSFALGIGYGFPTSIEMPNRTSVRMRLSSGLTFEPMLNLSATSETVTTMTEVSNKITTLGLDVLARLPVISRRKVDFEILGGAGYRYQKENPDGDFNTVTENAFTLLYGIGLAYWHSPHWQISMSTLNPLVAFTRSERQTGPAMTTTNSETTLGLIFEPSVIFMIHLYN